MSNSADNSNIGTLYDKFQSTFKRCYMNSDVYTLVTIKDGKTDADSITEIFSQMAAGRLSSDLMLVNYYDELPVSYRATVTSAEKDNIELAVHEHQALIMKQDKSTLIKSSHFNNGLGVHCYATYVNIPKRAAFLSNFAYAQIRAERREAVRVKVHEKVPVTFSWDGAGIVGSLVDISGSGVSINCERAPELAVGQTGQLKFTLSGSLSAAPGTFVRSTPTEDDRHVCIFQMQPDRRSDIIIGQFIYQRQIEIIRELKDGVAVD
jgi:hypothetical protein